MGNTEIVNNIDERIILLKVEIDDYQKKLDECKTKLRELECFKAKEIADELEREQERKEELLKLPITDSDNHETRILKLKYQLEQTEKQLLAETEDELDQRRMEYVEQSGGWLNGYHNECYCEDYCRGWNGQDRRCECGNRRIDWDDDLDFSAY
jgi:hypothetical protein